MRKDPQKTAGVCVLATLGFGALVLYLAYLRTPPAPKPQTLSIYPPKPTTRPTTNRSEYILETGVTTARTPKTAVGMGLEFGYIPFEQARAGAIDGANGADGDP